MSKVLIAITALAAALLLFTNLKPQPDEFSQWKTKFGAKFSPEEETFRKEIFLKNVKEINQHNGLLGTSYKMGINQFTVLTEEEFVDKHLSFIPDAVDVNVGEEEDKKVGMDVDWQAYGAVSSVKDEGSCQANYAFSAIGAIEGANYIWNRNAVEFSVQQVVDCSSGYGNNGCSNGRMDNTFNYVKDRGINSWANYPWVGYLQSCKMATGVFRIGGYRNATGCSALESALINQPVSVAVDGRNFRSYSTGVFYNCGTSLSLAALLVGMTDSFWRVKLSWGTQWGEAGYIRLSRGNTCGICNQPSYPTR